MYRLTRRRALGAGASAVVGLALTGAAPSAGPSTAKRAAHKGAAHAGPGHEGASPAGPGHEGASPAGPRPFDETYQGRRIQGAPAHAGVHHHGGGYSVHIDGKELHVMRNADGSWISVVNHYETFADPRAVARAAVVELQGAVLVPLVPLA